MERWAIINKLVLIFYIALVLVSEDTQGISWAVFLLLIYLCINICSHLFTQRVLMTLLLLVSMTTSIIGGIYVYPLFFLLLPLSVVELLGIWKAPKILSFIVAVIPVFYIQSDIQAQYVLVMIYTFLTYTMSMIFHERHMEKESQLDVLHMKQQKLLKQMNENDAYLKQSAYMLKLEERNRISQEIHDTIGHSITGALIQMEAAKRLMKEDRNKATELLQNAIGITQDGIDSIRLTLKNMKPPIEQVGINRLQLYIDEFTAKHNKRTVLTHNGNMDDITPIQWKVIQENVTEALTNSLKYAWGSTQISIDVQVLNKLIRVEVKDNGKGAEKIKKGLGIIGMEERTAAIDGKIIIDGSNGFTVTILLPVNQ
ncbi:sensor histidine kinase [Bacillus norwichensis]|uniref:histidine kinase n=1 Tax=Bacillus norwichensis TaxID=2762217 RepID=A0ABR8VGL8_9BACI|nr:histidine kinase [Bacillus norwichensis]MBD8003916.1 sensor histidine kinase [Bacillus norwichensis]